MTSGYGYVYNSGFGYERFDGVDDHILTTRTVDFTNTSEQTFATRIEGRTVGSADMIYCWYLNSSNYWYVYINTDNTIYFLIRTGGVERSAKTSTTIGTSANIVCRKDGGVLEIWINGVEASYNNQDTYNIGSTSFGAATVSIRASKVRAAPLSK